MSLSLFAAAALAPFFWNVPTGTSTSSATASATAVTTTVMAFDEQRFMTLANKERAEQGLPQLKFDPTLVAVARAHSREMAQRNYFAHESPTPGRRSPMQRYLSTCRDMGNNKRPQQLVVGENIFYCSAPGVERGHRAFMNSEHHRENIMDNRFEAVGIGTYTNEKGEYWVTQVFLKRRD